MMSLPAEGSVANGEVLFVDPNRSSVAARVTLSGAVAVPGVHALGNAGTLSGLLRDSDDLGPTAYTLFAVIVRHDPTTNFLKMLPFSIKGVFDGTENLKLSDNDTIYVFSTPEIQALSVAAANAVYTASQAPGVGGAERATGDGHEQFVFEQRLVGARCDIVFFVFFHGYATQRREPGTAYRQQRPRLPPTSRQVRKIAGTARAALRAIAGLPRTARSNPKTPVP